MVILISCIVMYDTGLTGLTRTLVSLYKFGRIVSSKSLIREGLLWAAELKATSATLRTF